MLPKNQRFTREMFPRGKPLRRLSFSWGSIAVHPAPQTAVSVVISKKTLKKAHDRNRLRRRLYAAVGEALKGNTANAGAALVLFPRAEALFTPLPALTSDIARALA